MVLHSLRWNVNDSRSVVTCYLLVELSFARDSVCRCKSLSMLLSPKEHMYVLKVVFAFAHWGVEVSCSLPSHMMAHKARSRTNSPEDKFRYCKLQFAVLR